MAGERDPLARWAKARFDAAVLDRANFDTLWQEITQLVIPREATYTEEVTQGQERQRHIVDGTAPRALELFASFVSTTAHNPSSKFFKIKVFGKDEKEIKGQPAVDRYAEEVEDVIWQQMNAAKVQSQFHKVDIDLGSIGTGALIIEKNSDPDAKSRLKFMSGHMQNIYVVEGEDGTIDTVFRCVDWTAEQWRKKFPDAELGNAIEKALTANEKVPSTAKFKGFHMVFEMYKGISVPGLPENLKSEKYVHLWVMCHGDPVTVEKTGGDRFKYAVPRWYTTKDEAYGRSPAMTVMPEIRMANRMRDTILRAGEKAADPPQLLPDGKLIGPLRLFAGGVSFTDGDVVPQSLVGNGTRYDVSERLHGDTRDAIREGFFVPLFATPDAPVKTATQVLQETDERNRAVSPMMIRMFEELLEPTLNESFLILDEVNALPPKPAGFEDAVIKIQYISPILAAQKQTEALGTIRLIEGLLTWVEAKQNPGILDLFDENEVALVQHEGSGAPRRILARKSVVEARARGRQEAVEEEAQKEDNIQLLDALSKFKGGAAS